LQHVLVGCAGKGFRLQGAGDGCRQVVLVAFFCRLNAALLL
jgi:hypothetical protein